MSTPTVSEYTLHTELKGAKGAVNALIFSKDGNILLSGGDDECVRVWNTTSSQCLQVLHGGNKWGQVTTLSWICPHVPNSVTSICVGTGRGILYLCPMSGDSMWFRTKDASTTPIFEYNDAVEAQAYDPPNQRLAVASHSGQIKMFQVDKVTTTLLWSANLSNAIPRGIAFFGGANQSLLIHGLETGEMCCRDAQNSTILWSKTLAGGIGNAILSFDETSLLVDNLTSGAFDIYQFPASTPSMTFSLGSTRRFIKQGVFAEDAKIAVCGSDQGRVHIVDVVSGQCLQLLQSGQEGDLIQAVAVTNHSARNMIAGASTTAAPGIYIWEKKSLKTHDTASTSFTQAPPLTLRASFIPEYTRQTVINTIFATTIILLTYPHWSPYFWKSLATSSAALAGGAHSVATFSGATGSQSIAKLEDTFADEIKTVVMDSRLVNSDTLINAGGDRAEAVMKVSTKSVRGGVGNPANVIYL